MSRRLLLVSSLTVLMMMAGCNKKQAAEEDSERQIKTPTTESTESKPKARGSSDKADATELLAKPSVAASGDTPAKPTPTYVPPPPMPMPAMRPNTLALRPKVASPATSSAPSAPTTSRAPTYHTWDPKTETLSPKPSETKWHTSPGKKAIGIYTYNGASDWDYAVEIVDEKKKRVSIFPNVERAEVGGKGAYLYLSASDLSVSGAWTHQQRILEVDTGISHVINDGCSSDAKWSGDTLLQWYGDPVTKETSICVINHDGVRIATVDAKLLWHAGSGFFLSAEMGMLPKDPTVMWVKELEEGQVCTVHMQSIVDPAKRTSVKLHTGAEWKNCFSTETNFTDTTLADPKVLFRMKDDFGRWMTWRNTTP